MYTKGKQETNIFYYILHVFCLLILTFFKLLESSIFSGTIKFRLVIYLFRGVTGSF